MQEVIERPGQLGLQVRTIFRQYYCSSRSWTFVNLRFAPSLSAGFGRVRKRGFLCIIRAYSTPRSPPLPRIEPHLPWSCSWSCVRQRSVCGLQDWQRADTGRRPRQVHTGFTPTVLESSCNKTEPKPYPIDLGAYFEREADSPKL